MYALRPHVTCVGCGNYDLVEGVMDATNYSLLVSHQDWAIREPDEGAYDFPPRETVGREVGVVESTILPVFIIECSCIVENVTYKQRRRFPSRRVFSAQSFTCTPFMEEGNLASHQITAQPLSMNTEFND